jgi:hypothetical protein
MNWIDKLFGTKTQEEYIKSKSQSEMYYNNLIIDKLVQQNIELERIIDKLREELRYARRYNN